MSDILDIVVIGYICAQLLLVFIVSITGVVYVRRQIPQIPGSKPTSLIALYLSTVWKLRSVYGSFFVHIFDVFTDLVVIVEWLRLEPNNKDVVPHIDATAMAINAICVLFVHKIVSVLAFWTKEGNITRCILQFFDLLVIQEVYVAHSKIVNNFNNKHDHEMGNEPQQQQSNVRCF